MLDGSTGVETKTAFNANNDGLARRLANLKPAQKGEPSRNPRGRPKKDLDLAAMAQKHAEQAVLTLAEVMMNGDAPPSARVSAAAEILDRGFGRAPASLDVNHKLGISEEFEQFMRGLIERRQPQMIEAEVVHAVAAEENVAEG